MPTVLAIAPGTPSTFPDRHLLDDRFTIDLRRGPQLLRSGDAECAADLLVIAMDSVDEQQRLAATLQRHRCWRLVPVLYVLSPAGGFSVPGSYRADIDGLVRGSLASPDVQRRIAAMARDGVAAAEVVVAGPVELDPVRGLLHVIDRDVVLTDREADVLTALLRQPNCTVSVEEIIERGWGSVADGRHLQILRRHVSNIRRKLDDTAAARSVRTVRGSGYRFDLRGLSVLS